MVTRYIEELLNHKTTLQVEVASKQMESEIELIQTKFSNWIKSKIVINTQIELLRSLKNLVTTPLDPVNLKEAYLKVYNSHNDFTLDLLKLIVSKRSDWGKNKFSNISKSLQNLPPSTSTKALRPYFSLLKLRKESSAFKQGTEKKNINKK